MLESSPPPNRPSPKGSVSSSGFPLGKPDPQGAVEKALEGESGASARFRVLAVIPAQGRNDDGGRFRPGREEPPPAVGTGLCACPDEGRPRRAGQPRRVVPTNPLRLFQQSPQGRSDCLLSRQWVTILNGGSVGSPGGSVRRVTKSGLFQQPRGGRVRGDWRGNHSGESPDSRFHLHPGHPLRLSGPGSAFPAQSKAAFVSLRAVLAQSMARCQGAGARVGANPAMPDRAGERQGDVRPKGS